MAINNYHPPISKLLTYGECRPVFFEDWPNYVQKVDLTAEHISELIQMATDNTLEPENNEGIETWAPIHAWRALGQLEAQAATTPLLKLLEDPDNEWAQEEIPVVMSLIGPSAMSAVQEYIANSSHDIFGRLSAINYFKKLQARYPEQREQCIDALSQQLAKYQQNEPALNGFLIPALCDLDAVEKAPEIEKAFAAQRVDLSIMGDWDEVQVDLGLKSREEVPRRRFSETEVLGLLSDIPGGSTLAKLLEQRPSPKGFSHISPSQKRKKGKKKR